MNDYEGHMLKGLVAARRAGRLSRRGFIIRAAQLGIGLPLAASLAKVSAQSALAAPSLALQDGGKTLVVAIPQATVQLDPAVAGSNGYGDIIPLADNITEGLTRFKTGGVEIEQALSDGWDISEDGTGYLFHIRSGVKFHDGTPLDAKAVETNFLRQMDEKNPLHLDTMVYAGIVFADVKSVAADGEMLNVVLTKPSVLLPGNLAIFDAGIVSPTALE
jgi:peptide/nickel transport system substrate-binding protein